MNRDARRAILILQLLVSSGVWAALVNGGFQKPLPALFIAFLLPFLIVWPIVIMYHWYKDRDS